MTNQELIVFLHGQLKAVQKQMFSDFYKSEGRKYVIHSARRLGKTYLLVIIACIVALSKSNAQIRYASVTQKAVRKMIHPIFKEVFSKAPLKIRPKWNNLEGAYQFANGSEIHIAGVNNGHSDDLRGTAADLCIVDEAAFVDELSYLVDSVLMPQLLTVENSKLIMASSSPLSPAHQFTSYIHEARDRNSYAAFDIYQGGYPEDTIEEFCKEAGGKESTTWRREYLNEIIVDSQYAIVPEFNPSIIQEYEPTDLDKYFHRYVGMDIGTKDFTAIVSGVYDFQKASVFILDEKVLKGPEVTTSNIASSVTLLESTFPNETYRRVADNNNIILLQDLGTLHQKHFIPTNKDSLEAMVNELRLYVQSGRLFVSPKCTHLLGCLEFGVWNNKRTEWGRSSQYGHFDALAALMYLVRNIDQHTNPIPKNHSYTFDQFVPQDEDQNAHSQIKKILNL